MSPLPFFTFPKWANKITVILLLAAAFAPFYIIAWWGYGFNARTLNVGFSPIQPVPFSHALHAGRLGIDCRYCHTTVEDAAFAAIPPAQTCMNCHTAIAPHDPRLAWVRRSYRTGMPIPWVKVDDLPDYVYFNHSAHINAGVSCFMCHGKVNHMARVVQVKPLNMAFCLACHRHPEPNLRPRDEVTNLDWTPKSKTLLAKDLHLTMAQVTTLDLPKHLGRYLFKRYHIKSKKQLTDCVTCHR